MSQREEARWGQRKESGSREKGVTDGKSGGQGTQGSAQGELVGAIRGERKFSEEGKVGSGGA